MGTIQMCPDAAEGAGTAPDVTFATALAAHNHALRAFIELPADVSKSEHDEFEDEYLSTYQWVTMTSAPTLADLLEKAEIMFEDGPGTPSQEAVALFMRDLHRIAGKSPGADEKAQTAKAKRHEFSGADKTRMVATLLNRHSPQEIADAVEILIDVLGLLGGDSDAEDGDEARCAAGDDGCGPFIREGNTKFGAPDEDGDCEACEQPVTLNQED
jgi:hypothetical protein